MTTYITKLYDRLDRICYEYYGNTDNKIVEYVLSKNPGLEKEAILLTPGITINLPDPPAKVAGPQTIKQIFLWN